MTLRDASAFNIQFAAGRPILIDTSSFGIAEQGRPWIAYRQFCEQFLAPLAVMAYVDPRLARLSQLNVEGVPLDLAVRLLPRRARLRPSLLLHLFLHARAQRRFSGGAAPERRRDVSSRALRGLLESLRTAVSHLPAPRRTGTWSEYDATMTHYSDEASSAKASAVSTLLDEIVPRTAWDLGANVGRYSRIATEKGIDVVAFDLDHDAVDANYRRVREDGDERLLPLVLDLTAPSPAIGWANRERMALAERGPADVVLALALIHHLAIANNVPLPRIASFLASLGRYAVVEFVPKDDVMVAALLRDREDIFPDYSPDGFVDAFTTVFELRRTIPIADSSRVLYLFARR
jgi:hypothetical protein